MASLHCQRSSSVPARPSAQLSERTLAIQLRWWCGRTWKCKTSNCRHCATSCPITSKSMGRFSSCAQVEGTSESIGAMNGTFYCEIARLTSP